MYIKLLRVILCTCAFLVGNAANSATTINFDSLTSGSLVTAIDGVTFSSSVTPEYGLDLVVSSLYDTSSGANYLGVNDGGSEAFFPGDTIDLAFDTPVTSLSMNFISTPLTPASIFSITTSIGSSLSGATPDYTLADGGEVFNVMFTSAIPFSTAQLYGGAGGVHTYNIDDITFTVVPVPPAILLFMSGLLLLGRKSWRSRNK